MTDKCHPTRLTSDLAVRRSGDSAHYPAREGQARSRPGLCTVVSALYANEYPGQPIGSRRGGDACAEPGGIYSSYLKSPGESPARWAAARSCAVAGVRGEGAGPGRRVHGAVSDLAPQPSLGSWTEEEFCHLNN